MSFSERENDTAVSPDESEVSRLLEELKAEPGVFDRILPLIYEDMRRLAGMQKARFRVGPTLQTTMVVHEAFLKLRQSNIAVPRNQRHMMRLANMVIRQVIVDHARQRLSAKRGSGHDDVSLNEELAGDEQDARAVIAVHEALDRLAERHPDMAELVIARFFGGYTLDEVGEILGVSRRTVARKWQRARAWMLVEMGADE